MKSIKEKAAEYRRVIKVIDEYKSLIYTQGSETFEAGANYVVEEIEKLVKTTIGDGGTYHYNLYIGLINLLEQLKK
jgi:hypothetical protein